MLQDKLLILRFKHGSSFALRRIYEKYRTYLLRLAAALLHDTSLAEDVVHDVFLRFVQSADKIRVQGSLKSYLRTCVVNAAHNKARYERQRASANLDDIDCISADSNSIDNWVSLKEESMRIKDALVQLPIEQRQAVVLHLHGDMKFREIAELQAVSVKTIQSRYYYGIDKLRSILNSEVQK